MLGTAYWSSFRRTDLEVTMLNVGQGASFLVHEPGGKIFLFDGGPDSSVLTELGQSLAPWERSIDLIVLSHLHTDHLVGIIYVLREFKVKAIWIPATSYTTPEYSAFSQLLSEHPEITVTTQYATRNCSLPTCPHPEPIGESTAYVWYPPAPPLIQPPPDQHDANLVVQLRWHQYSALFSGDIGTTQRAVLSDFCHQVVCNLRSQLLTAPHHGSKTGLDAQLLSQIDPEITLIPVGKGNPYHHPHPSTLALLAAAKTTFYRSDLNGRTQVVLGSTTISAHAAQGSANAAATEPDPPP